MMTQRLHPNDFDSVLDFCLTDLQTSSVTLQQCLAQFPEHAAQLAPLLRAAVPFVDAPRLRLSPSARESLEGRLRAHVPALPAPRARPRHRFSLRSIRWLSLATAGVLLAVFFSASVVAASAGSLPGDALYSVKRWSEAAAVQFAGDALRADLHLEYAQRRLSEFQALADRGVAEPALLSEFEAAARAAIESSRVLAEPRRSEALARAEGLSRTALDSVTNARAYLPHQAWPSLDVALTRLAGLRDGVLSLLSTSPATAVPATLTPSASATGSPARTPQPGEAMTSMPTPPGQGTPGGGLTHTPKPTPPGQGTPGGGLTKTPRPTPPGQGTPGGGLTRTPSGQGTPAGGPPNTAPGQPGPQPTHEPKPTKVK